MENVGSGDKRVTDLLPLMKGEQDCLEVGCLLDDGRTVGEMYLVGTGYPEVSGECRKVDL